MSKLIWDKAGERLYETGVDHGVLYLQDELTGEYDEGYAWNGLVSVTESPTGAEANPQFADNIKYLNLISTEEFGATIEAFTYPDKFALCDGTAEPEVGIMIGQQTRKAFGFSYRTLIGNDLQGTDHGYKIHLVYNALATPTEKAYTTINDTPEALTFSWDVTTTAVDVPGFKPTAHLTIDSRKADADALSILETMLYGGEGTNPELPLPEDVIALFSGTDGIEVIPEAPTWNALSDEVTIVDTTGVEYQVGGVARTGTFVITESTTVTAVALSGYFIPFDAVKTWNFDPEA